MFAILDTVSVLLCQDWLLGISKVGFRRHSSAKTLRPPGCKDAKALIGVDGRCIVAAGCKQLLGWAHDHSTDFIPFETARHLLLSMIEMTALM